jgi:hypothetical protein
MDSTSAEYIQFTELTMHFLQAVFLDTYSENKFVSIFSVTSLAMKPIQREQLFSGFEGL